MNQVKDLIVTTRQSWLVLLVALLFVSVTLASIKDVSFFVSGFQTKIPVIDVTVPTTTFLWLGSPIIAAAYIYLHFYLEIVWFELAKSAPQKGEGRIADIIPMWLVTDSALRIRDRFAPSPDHQPVSRKRTLGWLADIATLLLVWVFGVAVVGAFWWKSMVAHDLLLTGILGFVLILTLGVCVRSLALAWCVLAERKEPSYVRPLYAITIFLIVAMSVLRAELDIRQGELRKPDLFDFLLRPAAADLRGTQFNHKPDDWKGERIEKAAFRAEWCQKSRDAVCNYPLSLDAPAFSDPKTNSAFEESWRLQWDLRKKKLNAVSLRNVDLRGANFSGADLEGVDLENAKVAGANFTRANIAGTNLSFRNTTVRGINFSHQSLADSDFSGSDLTDSNFRGAVLESANLTNVASSQNTSDKGVKFVDATLDNANLWDASLNGADFTGAKLRGRVYLVNAEARYAKFRSVEADGANFRDAELKGADFTSLEDKPVTSLQRVSFKRAGLEDASFQGAKLHRSTFDHATLTPETNFSGADLSGTRFVGCDGTPMVFGPKALQEANLDNAMLRYVDLSKIAVSSLPSLVTAYGDASVKLPEGMGAPPAHWSGQVLSHTAFVRGWNAWVRKRGLAKKVAGPLHDVRTPDDALPKDTCS